MLNLIWILQKSIQNKRYEFKPSQEIFKDMDNLNAEKLLVNYPSLKSLKDDMTNLDDIGQYMLRKYIKGKSKHSFLYNDHAWAITQSQNIPIAAMSNAPQNNKPSIWTQIKEEFHKLVCTKDRKYTKQRNKLFASSKVLTNSVVIYIAASIGKVIGIATGVITGAIAALVFAVAKIGLNVYCNAASKNS